MFRKLLALTLLVVCVLVLPGPLAAQTPTAGQVVTGTAPALTLPPDAAGEVRLTVLFDNLTPVDSRLTSSFGFAALVEHGGHKLLFDTGGSGDILLDNMKQLGVDPQAIEAVILSHTDSDHAGGLEKFLSVASRPTIYLAASAFTPFYKNKLRAQASVIEVTDTVDVVPGVHVVGAGDVRVEQALVVETRDGTVVITGCAHPGVVKMVRAAKTAVKSNVALLAGGFHLGSASKAELASIVADLRGLGVQGILPAHCTGDAAIAAFRTEFGANYIAGGAGRTVTMPVAAPQAATQAPVRVLFVGAVRTYAGAVSSQDQIRISPAQGVTLVLTADPDTIPIGKCAVLRWEASPLANAVYLNGEPVLSRGEREVCPKVSIPYSLVALTPDGPKVQTMVLRVGAQVAQGPSLSGASGGPISVAFVADPALIACGACSDLRWNVAPGDWPVRLEGQLSPPAGTLSVCPSSTRSYRLHVEAPPASGGPRDFVATVQVATPAPPPVAPKAPPPAPGAPVSADIAPTDVFPDNLPRGQMWVDINNRGPDTLVNKHVWVQGQANEFPPGAGNVAIPHVWGPKEYTLNLEPGETAKFNLGWPVDNSTNRWEFSVTAKAEDFTDPNPGNDTDTEVVDARGGGPPAPPAPGAPVRADIAVGDVYPDNLPHGQMWVGINNRGPDTLVNKHVWVQGQANEFPPGAGNVAIPHAWGPKEYTLNLKPGETAKFNLGWPVDASTNRWEFSATAKAVEFTDPNPGNDTDTEVVDALGMPAGPPPGPSGAPPGPGPAQPAPGGQTVDLAVTDLYPEKPQGNVWLRVTNNGPATLNNVDAEFKCGASGTPIGGSSPNWSYVEAPWTAELTLKPGETKAIQTNVVVDLTQSTYNAFCAVRVLGGYTDPNVSNDKYTETIAAAGGPPAPPGPAPVQPVAPGGKTVDLAVTDLYPEKPQGNVWLRVTNNGPATLKDVDATQQCDATGGEVGETGPDWSHQEPQGWPLKLTLKPGETGAFKTMLDVDLTKRWYKVSCRVQVKGGYTDSNASNDQYTENFASIGTPIKADLAVTGISMRTVAPKGPVYFTIKNNGPDSLANVLVNTTCTETTHPYAAGSAKSDTHWLNPMLTLKPGEEEAYETNFEFDTTQNWYDVSCKVNPGAKDPNEGNNSHSERIPPPP